jgi:hypothetical protein
MPITHWRFGHMHPLIYPLQRVVILMAIGLAFGWLGPYGTYNGLGVVERFVFWMTAIPIIGLLSMPAVRMVAQLAPSWPVPARVLAGALVVGIPATLVTVALRSLFPDAPPITPLGLPRLYFSVTAVIALISIPLNVIRQRHPEAAAAQALSSAAVEGSAASVVAPEQPQAQRGSPFLQRIPPKLGRELLYIATEDHYLRVATRLGSDLILFRLSDAIAELDPAMGQQVHRSFWVARAAISTVERKGGRTLLVLIDGTRVPVSRTHLRNLRDAGWLTLPPRPLAGFTSRSAAAPTEEGEGIRSIN